MKKNKKNYLIAGIIIAGVLVGRSLLLRKPSDEIVYTVNQGRLADTIQVSGVYTTAAQTEVISPAKGVITKLYVKNNDEVKKGDPLFHVESTATAEEKAAALANYQSAINNLRIARQNKDSLDTSMWAKQKAYLDARNNLNSMNSNLLEGSNNPATGDEYTELEINSIRSAFTKAEKDFLASEKQYKEADIAIASAQAAVASSKLSYDATKSITVKAPANGKVVNLLKKIGDGVTASTANKIAEPVLIIANLENPSITAKISEAYIPRLKEGQKAEIVFDAARDQTFEGFIEAIDTVGTDVAGVITYNARIAIKDITPNIRPNMTGVVTISTFYKDNILSVPNSAILFKDGKTYVKKAGKEKDNLIEVKLGVRGLVKTEIVDGLSEGTEIVANISSN